MMLIALLVFLVLRQVMPIASGLAGGASLNSFGIPGRGVFWGARAAGKLAKSYAGFVSPYVARSVGYAVRGTGQVVRSAAAHSGRYIYGRAGAGLEALSRNWRNSPR